MPTRRIDIPMYREFGLVSMYEAQTLLQLTPSAIKDRIKDGRLEAVVQANPDKSGRMGQLFITRKSLLAYLECLPRVSPQKDRLAQGMDRRDREIRHEQQARQKPIQTPSMLLGDGGIVQPATPPPRRPLVLPNKHPVTPTEMVDGEPVLPPALPPRRKPKGA